MNITATNWREVRDLLNQADDQQLAGPIHFLGESSVGVGSISILSENMYKDDYYISPESELSTDFEKPDQPIYQKGAFIVNLD